MNRTASIIGAALVTVALLTYGPGALGKSFSGTDYLAGKLLTSCQEADNDARWGEVAELECEQYILGFVDATAEVGAAGAGTGICPPVLNTADEVRWAFMRWVHEDYSKRIALPAADALLATLKASFACS